MWQCIASEDSSTDPFGFLNLWKPEIIHYVGSLEFITNFHSRRGVHKQNWSFCPISTHTRAVLNALLTLQDIPELTLHDQHTKAMLWWNKIFQKYGHKEQKKFLILSNIHKNSIQRQWNNATSWCLLGFKISFKQEYKEIVNHLHLSKLPTPQQ